MQAGDLDAAVITTRLVHGVTRALERTYPGEDAEGLEYVATLSAADDSLRLMTPQTAVMRRIVAVAEVDNSALALPANEENLLPTALYLEAELPWAKVESVLVDEPGGENVVEAAVRGDEQAFLATEEIELMWYDVLELKYLRRELLPQK